jgi:hypothetical protein
LSSVHRFCGGKACLGFSLPQTPLMWEPSALGLPLFSLQNLSVHLNENLTIFSSAICSLNLRPNYNIYVSLIKYKLVLPPWANFLLCNNHGVSSAPPWANSLLCNNTIVPNPYKL